MIKSEIGINCAKYSDEGKTMKWNNRQNKVQMHLALFS